MNTPVITRSLIALIVEMVALALAVYGFWRTRVNIFTEERTWRIVLNGAVTAALLVCLWLIYESAATFLRATHIIASARGALS